MPQDVPRWATPLPTHRADRLRALALPALLVSIAVLGVVRSTTLDQSSWQGASFGMFATYDNRSSRSVVVTVTHDDGTERRVGVPDELQGTATRLKVVPTTDAATALAEAVLAHLASGEAAEVAVEVWRVALVDDDGELRLHVDTIASGRAAP